MKKLTLFLVAITMSLFSLAQSQMSGTYTVGTGGSYDYSSMADAGMAIKAAEFTGDVTLLICTDLTETINTGIVNKSEYTLTIRPDKDEDRTITYTTATDNTGPTGVFVIGGDMTKTPGSTIGWASVPTKNVIVDGAAEGKTTPRLKITNEKWGTNVILYGDVQDVVIRNCILTGRSSSTAYALVFRSENYAKTSNDVAPKNYLVENCVLQSSSSSSQTIYFQGNQANSAAGYPTDITIRNCDIKAHTRGVYVRQVKNLTVEGCTIDMSDATAGILAHGILGEKVVGTAIVRGNKFVKNSTKNFYGGSYGLQTITASGGADVWVIENNYFAGYDALSSITNTTNGTEGRLVAVRCGDSCVVRHNTFHMPKLTKTPASALVGSQPTALLWLAGSKQYPVQNNIFICEEETANVSLIRGGLNPNVTGNVFFHNGGNAAIVAAAPSCMTFADLETSYPTQAATSKWKNVTFTDAANGDLSLAGKSNGDPDLAVNRLAEVLTDITGKNRREKTCAGAYEGREPLPSSITLNAHPVKDYSASIVGTMKRAIQNGENTIILTHEANGTAHIYNIAHATKTVTEISQEGVVAVDPDNAGDFLAISDIALTADGKLVACNYMLCQNTASYVDAGYKRGTTRFYIWDEIDGDPTLWFTSQQSVNYYRARVGYTMALKGTSDDAWVIVAGFNNNATGPARFDHYHIVNGSKSTTSPSKAANMSYSAIGNTYEISASPLADGNWVLDGELAVPTEFVESKDNQEMTIFTPIAESVLGKKYNGATYLANYNGHHLMIAPYAGADDKLAGVKVLGISDGFAAATLVTTATDLATAINATTAAATAYVDGDGDLTIYLIADGKVYTFSEKVLTIYHITAHAADNAMGYVTGGGTYSAGETVTLKAVANSTYCFVSWSDGNTENPRTFTATADVTLTANFAKATPRAWAYDLKMVEDGDKYKFSFTATTAANATLLFLDKEGNELYAPHNMGAVAAGANTVSIEKAYFTQVKDVYWSVKMDGEAITSVAEITDQSRNIYDFYNMQGVVVDNDPNSEKFGEIYIEMAKSGTTNGKAQTLGLFLLNQNLDVLNTNPNVGIQPTMPDGYALDGTNYTFQRLNIHPKTGDLVFSYGISSKPAVFAIDRENMTGDVTNLLDGISGLTKTVAHCFDAEGTLYVMDIASSKGTIYKIKDGIKTVFAATTGRFVSSNITMAADGRGGLWVAQYRGQIDYYYQLVHFNDAGTADFSVYDDKGTYNATNGTVGVSSTGFTGHSYRGALAYDVERQILAQGRNSTVEVFQVSYDASTGVPTLTKIATTPQVNKANIDGLAFDYAGDLYMVNSGTEKFYKYTLPTDENICTVPAPESQAIVKEVRYTITVNTVGNGTATGAGEYVAGETATLEASPAANHQFVNWTYGSETSTNNPLELVVNSDITVTANFAPVQYTLIAPTNDEDKGTVTGAGTYNYGTEVTLTANPAAGYKLLYWSDRSTDNPRTIIMTKNEAISAYFVKDYAEEPTFKIEKMWENTKVPASTTNGYQAVGWNQKIYMQNRTAGKIITYSSAEDTGTDYATSGSGQQIAVDEAGNLIVFNAYFANSTPSAILIYQNGSTTSKAVTFTLKDPAACHFFSASGDIYSAEGGYVYFYCNGKTAINRLKITNGAATVADVTIDIVGGSIYAGGTQNHVMVDIFGNLVTHARSNSVNWINVYTNECKTFTLPSIKFGTLGGCSFELGGKELWAYHAGATNYSSEWNLYNMTDGEFLSDTILYAVDKTNSTNNAANWLNVQVVDENTAYIYQFCPKKAVAMWKVSINRTDLQEFTVTATANNPAMGTVTGEGTYYENATATLTATANAGYRFVNWTKAGVEVSTNATYTFTVTEDVELVANFEPLPEITYELNGGVWNKYGWTSKKDMYDAFIADWKAYSGSSRSTKTYEEQYGIGKSNNGIPVTIQNDEGVLDFMELPKWNWLAEFLDALAISQNISTKIPSSGDVHMRFALGNFFGEDNNKVGDSYVDAVDCSGDNASLSAFAPYWGQTFPMPTQPTEEVVLNAPYKEKGYEFDGWYTTSNFSGAEVTVVDENTNGTLYAKWTRNEYTRSGLTSGRYGTICLPYNSNYFEGAIFYEVAWMNTSVSPWQVLVDEVTELEAGKPYIFMATSNNILVACQGDAIASPSNYNGLYGTFTDINDGPAGTAGNVLEDNHMLSNNQIMKCLGNCQLLANRAYFKLGEIPTVEPALVPGRRRVALGVQGGNEATGLDNLTEDGVVSAMEGTYDVLGRKMTEPTNNGFYIVNGKKVVVLK